MGKSQQVRKAWLGLGGNIGNVPAALSAALQSLHHHDAVTVAAVSALYETPPWGVEDQPRFLNCCAAIDTRLAPEDLLSLCHQFEREGHRTRDIRWGPRTLDIDIIAFEGEVRSSDTLTLPHPRAAQRAFVVLPLMDIAPDLQLDGQPIATLVQTVDAAGIEQVSPDGEWWR